EEITAKRRRKNGVYAASAELTIGDARLGVPGYGVFRYDDALVLTRAGASSHMEWNLPEFFRQVAISYHGGRQRTAGRRKHPPQSAHHGQEFVFCEGRRYGWREEFFQSAHRGQEFVFD